jgi:hypothetical protein
VVFRRVEQISNLSLCVFRWTLFTLVRLFLVGLVVVDPQDLDEAEGGSQPAQGRLLVWVDLGHDPGRLPPGWLVAAGAQVQVDPAALELEPVDLALAVVLTTSLEGQDLQAAGEKLQLGQHFSDGHTLSVAVPAP